jgi:acetyl esterase/lipase
MIGNWSIGRWLKRPWQAVASDLLAERGIRAEKAVPYGEQARHRADIYHPARDTPDGPIVTFLYGGGWTSGERACYSFVGAALASRGITTVVPDYRLFPQARYPDFNEDAAGAFAWVQRVLNRDGRRASLLLGHSAGAHMATTIAYDRSYIRRADADTADPDGLIAISGPYAFHPTTWPTTKEIFATAPDPDSPRPIAHVGPHCPRSLLIYGLDDDVVQPENARELRDALRAAGVEARLIEYPGVGHILPITSFLRIYRWRVPVLRECVTFIERIAADKQASIRTAEPETSA